VGTNSKIAIKAASMPTTTTTTTTTTTQAAVSLPQKYRKGKRRRSSKGGLSGSFFHRMAAKNRLGSIKEGLDEANCDAEEQLLVFASYNMKRGKRSERPSLVLQAKLDLLSELKRAGGDSSTQEFQEKLETLLTNYDPLHFDPRRRVVKRKTTINTPTTNDGAVEEDSCCSSSRRLLLDPSKLEGVGISESKPVYPGCLGMNSKGEPMYKLQRMSFDMFRPTQLIVSIQGTFNVIDVVDGTDEKAVKYVPNNLLADVRQHGKSPVRKYNIITALSQSNLGFQSLDKTLQTNKFSNRSKVS
jgi:hypothetical protein